MCSSKWDGYFNKVVENKTPIYFVIGEDDEYYGSSPFKEVYQELVNFYKKQGLSDEENENYVDLDVKNNDYFLTQGIENQHGQGGHLFSNDQILWDGYLIDKNDCNRFKTMLLYLGSF